MKKVLKISIIIIFIIILSFIIYNLFFKKDQNLNFDIPQYQSNIDYDLDGIDDQTDILNGALEYVSKKPKYQSKYYNTGYPNDEYGVCTDVVAFSLLQAGYDLQALVAEDIKNNPDDYKDVGDKNIDFRRVRNLKIFFKHTAISLTLDPKDIASWQGGDIVIWDNHIGIVSNKRNKKGIPYVIHHYKKNQKEYEENKLESYGRIVGHYRIS